MPDVIVFVHRDRSISSLVLQVLHQRLREGFTAQGLQVRLFNDILYIACLDQEVHLLEIV